MTDQEALLIVEFVAAASGKGMAPETMTEWARLLVAETGETYEHARLAALRMVRELQPAEINLVKLFAYLHSTEPPQRPLLDGPQEQPLPTFSAGLSRKKHPGQGITPPQHRVVETTPQERARYEAFYARAREQGSEINAKRRKKDPLGMKRAVERLVDAFEKRGNFESCETCGRKRDAADFRRDYEAALKAEDLELHPLCAMHAPQQPDPGDPPW